MALSFPLDVSVGWNVISARISRGSYDLPEQVEMSQTGAGEVLQADLGPMLWRADVQFGALMTHESAPIEGLMDALRLGGRTIYVYDHRRPWPLLDPAGAVLGSSSVVISALHANSRDIRLSGLPSGYRLSSGDYLAFDYAGTRRALHRVVPSLVTTPGTGITPLFEVVPAIRPGAAIGAAVTLVKAAFKAVTVPNSINKGQTSMTVTTGMSMRLIQTTGA